MEIVERAAAHRGVEQIYKADKRGFDVGELYAAADEKQGEYARENEKYLRPHEHVGCLEYIAEGQEKIEYGREVNRKVRKMLASLTGGVGKSGLGHIVVHLREYAHIVAGRAERGCARAKDYYKVRREGNEACTDDDKREQGADVVYKEGELFALYIVCNYGDNSQKEQGKHYRGVSARVRVFCAVCY